MSTPTPSTETPNVVIPNPEVRNAVYAIFGWLSLALGALIVFDGASEAVDWSAWSGPATAVLAFIGAGIGYTASRNTP